MNIGLEALWRRQLAFTSLVIKRLRGKDLDQLTDEDRQELTREYIESLHSELVEALGTTSWKRHRFVQAAGRERTLEELVDIQKYLWGLMVVWGVTPGELIRAFNQKSDVVERRFFQEHVLPSVVMDTKVAIVDLDGTVADWSHGFEAWVVKHEPSLKPEDFASHVDPGLRTRLKAQAHAGGVMAELEVLPGAGHAIDKLVKAGYTVVWLTARPIDAFPRVESDTVKWLDEHRLPSEYIYWSDINKHLFVLDKLPMAAALFDDEPEIVAHAREFGVEAYLVERDLLSKVEEFLKGGE